MATYISYDAADSIIILLEPDTGIYRVSGHGDYQHPIEQLAGVQILPDWANWAKYTAPLLWFNLWHIRQSLRTERVPVVVLMSEHVLCSRHHGDPAALRGRSYRC